MIIAQQRVGGAVLLVSLNAARQSEKSLNRPLTLCYEIAR
jgi:hypothetical protein